MTTTQECRACATHFPYSEDADYCPTCAAENAAIHLDAAYHLRVGDKFFHRGRTYRLSDYAGWTNGTDARGDYARFKAWNDKGHEVWVTVR